MEDSLVKKLKFTPTRIFFAVLFFGLVMLVDFARRDMKLDLEYLRETLMNLPGMVMENIHMSREISGDVWSVNIPYLEQDGNTITMTSLDITRKMSGDSGEWYFFGREGIYSRDTRQAGINGLLGTLETDTRTLNLESQKLTWQDGDDSLKLSDGIMLYDNEFMLQAEEASIDRDGMILLQKGGVIKWVKPSEY